MTRFLLSLPLFLLASTHAIGADLPLFTSKDMYALARKIGKSLEKCKQLRSRPNVVVEVENKTGEIVDKTRFSQLIHGQIEWKTHLVPEANPPEFEIRAVLETKKESGKGERQARSIYTLTAQVFQADEKLCEKKASIAKIVSYELRPGDATP